MTSPEQPNEKLSKKDQAFLDGLFRKPPALVQDDEYWEAYTEGLHQAWIRVYEITGGNRN